MTGGLMDYVSAIHDVLAEALDLLTAELGLSDENSSALAVTRAEARLDAAAARLAEAVDGLDRDRRPAGWHEPPAVSGVLPAARNRVLKAALRVLSAEHADEGADAASESEHANEQLCLAARNLAADAEAHRAAKAETGGRLL